METVQVELDGNYINVKVEVDKDGGYDEKKALHIAKQLVIIEEVGLD